MPVVCQYCSSNFPDDKIILSISIGRVFVNFLRPATWNLILLKQLTFQLRFDLETVNERNAMDLKSGYSRPQHVGYSRNLFLIYKLIFIGTGIESG
jgi:hypothetical protein